jgi:hypothetical protein
LYSPTLAANPAIPRKKMTSAMGRTMMEKKLKAIRPIIGFKMLTSTLLTYSNRARLMPVMIDELIKLG